MDLLSIGGWIIVVWLAGSILYSSKFAIGVYLLRKQRETEAEGAVRELRKELHRQSSWSTFALIQIAKLVAVAILVFFLLK